MNLIERLISCRLQAEAGEGGDPGANAGTEPATENTPTGENGTPGGDEKNESGTEKPQGEDKGDKEKKAEGAPDKYTFSPPEGGQLDTEALAVFEPIAKELGLTQEQAQKLVDIYPQIQQQQAETWSKQVEQWGADAKADKEIAAGDKFQTNVGLAQRALDTFGTPELRTFLDTTGMGNHPEVIRVFMKVGKMMSEDSMILPNNNGGQLSAAEVLYGKK